ncbi:MAG: efflux RND transporter periplasmic adaptor subunit [Candidatus Sericytochromatia bacterium]|nr:efflux RND transporter periplasmic adaptor subunit [Candidatus Sericytochromatia bacterium]
MRARFLSLALLATLGIHTVACHSGSPDAQASPSPAPSGAARGGFFAFFKKASAPPSEAPAVLTVETQAVTKRQLPQQLEVTGSVTAWEPMPVSAAASGLRVTEIRAEEGQLVEKGQLLARLDDATLRAQVAAAEARASIAGAQLEKMRHPTRRQDLLAAEAAVVQAEAAARQAQDAYQRTQELAQEGAVTPMELIGRQTAAESARAAADQARARLSLAREGSRGEDLIIAAGQAAEARATLAQMQALLAQTQVRAPEAGRIIKKDVRLGDVSAPGKAFFQIVRAGRLEVEAQIPETDLDRVKPGQTAVVSSDARTDWKAIGHVREISPAIDPGNRQATVQLDIPASAGLRVGMFVRATLELGKVASLAVPASAVVTKESGSEVFVLDGKYARSRTVVPGLRADGWVAITSGLEAGEQVVTSGVGFLKDGDKVDLPPARTSHGPAAAGPLRKASR